MELFIIGYAVLAFILVLAAKDAWDERHRKPGAAAAPAGRKAASRR